jgi:anti-anti-sigma regulatory factor
MNAHYPDLSNATREELLIRLQEVRFINTVLHEQIVAERERVKQMATQLHAMKKAAAE